MADKDSDITEDLLISLCASLTDSEGKTLMKRHILLLMNYTERRKTGINLLDLPYLSIALEFLAANVAEVEQYVPVMLKCLKLLQKPILMHRFSDGCCAIDCMGSFFSSLGNCLFWTHDTPVGFLIINVILYLMKYNERNSKEVSLEIRREAVKVSCFPEIIVMFTQFATGEFYNSILEVTYQLTLQTHFGFVDYFLLIRCMDIWISNIPIKPHLSIRETNLKEITSNILWSVIRRQDLFKDPVSSPTLSSHSLSVLRGWLRREVLYGKSHERNNVAVLLLRIFHNIPKMEVSRSGVLEDIGLLAVASEFGTQNTWASKVVFKPTKDDLNFKKILITMLLVRFNKDTVTKIVLYENRFLNCISFLLEFPNIKGSFKWSKNQHIELINICLYALPIVSKHFKEDYTRSMATTRILQIIGYFAYKQQNLQLVKKSCLCLHLLVSSGISLRHFRILKVTPALINLIIFIMEQLKLSLLVQMILTYCFCVITNLVQDDKPSMQDFGGVMCNLSLLIFKRLENPLPSDSKISNSLLIAACDFVWQSTISDSERRKLFIDELGVYSTLNIMEEAHLVVQMIFLAMLTDLCLDPRSIPQIVTWWGKNTKNNFLSMLCALWRKQEIMKCVTRDEDGCIKDIEVSLMGEKQKSIEITGFLESPALVDMIGCARPKIAALAHLFTRRHYEKVRLAQSVYHIPFEAISSQDEITLHIIKCYEELKDGEILGEIETAVNTAIVTLLPLDTTVLHELRMRQIGLANEIQKRQKEILASNERKELEKEKELYNQINEVQLTCELKKTFELDSYLTISNQNYKQLKHMKYEAFLTKMDILYKKRIDNENFHKTFSHPRNFILVKTGRNVQIRSIIKKTEPISSISDPGAENLD